MRWALLGLLLACACAEDRVSIGDPAVLDVRVRRAETAAERVEGLRGRTLDDGEGLLLVFPVEDELCVSNAGVDQAIDAVFLDASATVTAVERGIPVDDPTVRCATGRWILEVLADVAIAVEPGMRADGL